MGPHSLNQAVKEADSIEDYNLAVQNFLATSFAKPVLAGQISGVGSPRTLVAIRIRTPDLVLTVHVQ